VEAVMIAAPARFHADLVEAAAAVGFNRPARVATAGRP
jgi:predicted dehydrogenase